MNIPNLLKLAEYLDKVPDPAFDMRTFVDALNPEEREYLATGRLPCGTTACAAGYGPAAGIAWDQPNNHGWIEYITGNFVPVKTETWNEHPEYIWCFSEEWSSVDNTPKGAAKRIRYLVANGVPPRFKSPSHYYKRIYQ